MQQSAITDSLLPIALGIIMLGLGLSLSIADFKRVLVYPRAILIGLFTQTLILPLICFGLASTTGLTPELAVGLMLLAASPGGATANLYSHLAKGDVALNISLTAVNSLLSLITLPILVNFSLMHFLGEGQYIPPQFKKIIEVASIILIPVAIGMFIRSRSQSFAEKMNKPVRIASVVILAGLIVAALLKDKNNVAHYFAQVGIAALLFNIASMLIGYYLPLLLKVERKQAIAIGMEIGIHNGTLAIYIAFNVLNNPAMSIPPAIYSLIMFFTAGIFGWFLARKEDGVKAS
jgi:BASS family bile acid:Na+ symporter